MLSTHYQLHQAWLRLKRVLGAAPPPMPAMRSQRDYLHTVSLPDHYVTDGFEPRHFIFELMYVGSGAGGFADIVHLGQAWQKRSDVNVFYRVPDCLDRTRTLESFRWTDPSVTEDQILFDDALIPEFRCATAWPTAYRVRVLPSKRKCYFVQDYESWFCPAGMERYYAERTHTLGLETFTLGPWLAQHIAREHGGEPPLVMPFPVFDEPRSGRAWTNRDTVAIYVQLEKAHRGAEILFETARVLQGRLHSDLDLRGTRIVLFGSHDLPYLKYDFPCMPVGVLNKGEMRELIDRSRVGVSLSFTNISLLPPRYVMGGAYAVEADLPHVRANVPPDLASAFALFAPEPERMAAGIHRLLQQSEPLGVQQADRSHAYEAHSWEECARTVAGYLFSENEP